MSKLGNPDAVPSILAIDPGKTTGLAWTSLMWATHGMKIDERFAEQVAYGQIGGPDVTEEEQTMMISRGIRDLDVRLVICESSDHFLLRQGSALNKSSLIPIRLGAMIGYACHVMSTVHGMDVVFRYETAAQGKAVLTNERMKALGLKLPNKDRHSMDALRHLITYLRRIKNKPELLEGVRTL